MLDKLKELCADVKHAAIEKDMGEEEEPGAAGGDDDAVWQHVHPVEPATRRVQWVCYCEMITALPMPRIHSWKWIRMWKIVAPY